PFEPYYKYCGTRQGWQMFLGVKRLPTRVMVEIEERGRWRTIYVEQTPGYPWLRKWLNHCRFRVVQCTQGMQEDPQIYPQLVNWFARQAARDFPGAERIRVGFLQLPHVPTPEEVREDRLPAGKVVQQRELALGPFR